MDKDLELISANLEDSLISNEDKRNLVLKEANKLLYEGDQISGRTSTWCDKVKALLELIKPYMKTLNLEYTSQIKSLKLRVEERVRHIKIENQIFELSESKSKNKVWAKNVLDIRNIPNIYFSTILNIKLFEDIEKEAKELLGIKVEEVEISEEEQKRLKKLRKEEEKRIEEELLKKQEQEEKERIEQKKQWVLDNTNDIFAFKVIGNLICLTKVKKKNLKSVQVPYEVEVIGIDAFRDCKKMTMVQIPATCVKIEDYAFYNCKNLKSIYIPESVDSFGGNVFWGCEKLASISVSDDNKIFTIMNNMFINKKTKTVIYYLPSKAKFLEFESSIKVIEAGAFTNNKNLEEIKFNKVSHIKRQAFMGCKKLKKMDLHYVDYIEYEGFKNCKKLERVDQAFPINIQSSTVFEGCNKFKRYYWNKYEIYKTFCKRLRNY